MMLMFLAQNLSIVRKPHVVAVVTFAVILLVMYSPFYPLLDRGSPNYKNYYKQLSLPGELKILNDYVMIKYVSKFLFLTKLCENLKKRKSQYSCILFEFIYHSVFYSPSNYCRIIASRYDSAFRIIQIGTCMVYFSVLKFDYYWIL